MIGEDFEKKCDFLEIMLAINQKAVTVLIMKETETQIRLRRAKEKAEDLFFKDQQEQVKRLKADYWHCTA